MQKIPSGLHAVRNEKAAARWISFNINGTVAADEKLMEFACSGPAALLEKKGLFPPAHSTLFSLSRWPCCIDWRVHNIVGTMTSHTQSYIEGGWLAGAESRGFAFNNNGNGARADLREDEMKITQKRAPRESRK